MFINNEILLNKYIGKTKEFYVSFLNGKLFSYNKNLKVKDRNIYLNNQVNNNIFYLIYLIDSDNLDKCLNVFIDKNVNVKIIEKFIILSKEKNISYCNFLKIYLDPGVFCEHYNDYKNIKNVDVNCKYFLKEKSALSSFHFFNNVNGTVTVSADLLQNFARVNNNTLFILQNNNKVDTSLDVNHFANECISNQICKSVLFDKSSFVFTGRIFGEKNISKSKANQFNHNFILSEEAFSISKPNLLLFSQGIDVSHGSTIHPINEELLFYLQSRGFDKANAIIFLFYGFCMDIINTIELELIKKIYIEEIKKYAQTVSAN